MLCHDFLPKIHLAAGTMSTRLPTSCRLRGNRRNGRGFVLHSRGSASQHLWVGTCYRQLKTDVHALEALYKKTRQHTGLGVDDFFHQRILDLFTLAAADADAMTANIRSLRETLPAANTDSTHLPHADSEYRIRRRSPFTIIGGVIGTLMGWFTQR